MPTNPSPEHKELLLECRRAQAGLLRVLPLLERLATAALSAEIENLSSGGQTPAESDNGRQTMSAMFAMISDVIRALQDVEDGVIKNLK